MKQDELDDSVKGTETGALRITGFLPHPTPGAI
jgi:hypothetical protein